MNIKGLAIVSFYVCSFVALILLTLVLTFAPPLPQPTLVSFSAYLPGQPLTEDVKASLTEYSDMYYSFYTSNYLYYAGYQDGWYVYVSAVNGAITYTGLYCRGKCTLLLGDVLQEYDYPIDIRVIRKVCYYTFSKKVRASAKCGGVARAHDWRMTVLWLSFS